MTRQGSEASKIPGSGKQIFMLTLVTVFCLFVCLADLLRMEVHKEKSICEENYGRNGYRAENIRSREAADAQRYHCLC